MSASVRGSAYPKTIDELMPDAAALVKRLEDLPSRNRLMTELRIGAPKADQLLARLREWEAEGAFGVLYPSGPDGEPDAGESGESDRVADLAPMARLRLVPDVASGAPSDDSDSSSEEPTNPTDSESPELLIRDDVDPDLDAPAGILTAELQLTPESSSESTPDGLSDPGVGVSPEVQTESVRESTPTPRRHTTWPIYLLALPAFVAVWSGWVGLGALTGFGVVHPLPGIWDSLGINTAITLPIGVETYAAFALRAWLTGPQRARRFAKWSAIGSLFLGAAGQVAYHLMSAAGVTSAPWQITTVVSCLPVIVLGMGTALAHLSREG